MDALCATASFPAMNVSNDALRLEETPRELFQCFKVITSKLAGKHRGCKYTGRVSRFGQNFVPNKQASCISR